jgi:hypothetical protein
MIRVINESTTSLIPIEMKHDADKEQFNRSLYGYDTWYFEEILWLAITEIYGKYTDALWDENIDIISVDEDWGKEPDDYKLVGTLRANVSQDILNWLLDHDLDVKVLSNSKQMVMKF